MPSLGKMWKKQRKVAKFGLSPTMINKTKRRGTSAEAPFPERLKTIILL